ncbi:MAG TPA: metal ABC transporter substrate-binding protein [Baekduia sp.]|uniref:metal ABC transporter substrate-binding protein n=1 Tax=Baekduia sp. TaxID=2600305 RepID=UPI002C24B499|nr:metal ABC transporter substrate-binding protein [Baekduia sp.]HMJ33473.1 metal ABC transporter substrate-binding protein [Baekduia sp.]
MRSLIPSRRRLPALAAPALAAAALVAGCGSSSSSGSDDGGGSPATTASARATPIDVVATTTQLGDVVRSIGGAAVDVHQILKPNSDPHDYEPRPDDIQQTAGAKLVVTSGDHLDQWIGQVVDNAGGNPAQLDAGAGRPVALPGDPSGAEASRFDPHWWHDPRNVRYAVDRIRAALIAADPSAKAAIDRGADAYLAKLDTLDAGIQACIGRVPAARRRLVTDHDAFAYFAHRYGIDVVGAVIPSQTTQAQPSAGDLAKLSEVIGREHVSAVFPESSINPKLARAIARQTGASADHTLYGDTLGPAGSPGGTYLGMEQANADAMVRGFTGGKEGCTIAGL